MSEKSKVILLNGSPKANGCTATALDEMIKIFHEEGVETELIHVGNKAIRGCISCGYCGNTASFDVLNKYFTISSMPVATSSYWNQVHGFTAEDVKKDLEGLQTIRNLARNMSFMMKAFAEAKEKYGLPLQEREAFTSFPDGK